jgi:hypothetical protein
MKLLSLWQPHASAMAVGLKEIETRGKRTNFRGAVAIHAAKKWDWEIGNIIESIHADFRKKLHPYIQGSDWVFPLGCIVAVGTLIDCLPTQPGFTSVFEQYPDMDTPCEREFGNYSAGRYGWVFEGIRPLHDPLPYKGSQCMLDLPADVVAEIMRRV